MRSIAERGLHLKVIQQYLNFVIGNNPKDITDSYHTREEITVLIDELISDLNKIKFELYRLNKDIVGILMPEDLERFQGFFEHAGKDFNAYLPSRRFKKFLDEK